MTNRPNCEFCDVPREAAYFAAQSIDQGKTVTWAPTCKFHVHGWNDGGDWEAPIFAIGEPLGAVHLSKPTGGTLCGEDNDSMTCDINFVTCETCFKAHEEGRGINGEFSIAEKSIEQRR